MKKQILLFFISFILIICVCGSTPVFADDLTYQEETVSERITESDISLEETDTITDNQPEETEESVSEESNSLNVMSSQIAAPEKLSAKSGKKGITLKWAKTSDSESFRIYRKTDGKKWKKIATVTTFSYTDTNVSTFTGYSYKILAVSNHTKSAFSSVVTAAYIPVSKISYVKIISNGIKLEWPLSSGASGYCLYRRLAGGNWEKIAKTVNTEYVDTSASKGLVYEYVVRPYAYINGSKYLGYYNSGYIKTITNLSTPTLKNCSSASKGVNVNWNSVYGAVKYKIYRKTSSENWTFVGKTSDTSFCDTTAKKGKLYYYTVTAVDKYGIKSYYDHTGITGCFVHGVNILSADNISNGVVLKWAAVKKAYAYKIYRKTSNKKWSLIAKVSNTLNYTDNSVKDGNTYQYKIKALIKIKDKTYTGYSGKKYVHTVTKMPAPSFKVYAYKSQGIKIKWDSVKGAAFYYIYKKNSDGKWIKIGKSRTDYFIDTDYSGTGTENVYTVRSVDANGNRSPYNSTGKIGVFVPMTKLTSISNTSRGTHIKWKKVKGASGYVIYYKKAGKSWSKITTISNSQRTSYYHYVTFKSGETYEYVVRPYKKVNGTDYLGSYVSSSIKSLKWTNKMVISPLANGAALCSWEYNDRAGNTITRITPHQMVAHWTAQQAAEYFVYNGIENSVNYCIGYDGSIWCNVTEDHRAWTSSSWDNDKQAITVELSNTTEIYSGKMTDETIEAFINLCVDLIQRYPSLGGKFKYTGNTSTGNISLHRWFSNTSCPGDWFISKIPYIQKQVNKRLKELNS